MAMIQNDWLDAIGGEFRKPYYKGTWTLLLGIAGSERDSTIPTEYL